MGWISPGRPARPVSLGTQRRKVELAAHLRALKKQGKRICGERDDYAYEVERLENRLGWAEAEIERLKDRIDELENQLGRSQ